MMVVDLQNHKSLPASIQRGLKECDRHFLKELYLENISDIPSVAALIEEIDDYCLANMVVGIHYTRAFPEDLLAQGLRLRTGEQIRREFLERFGNMFSAKELEQIRQAWARYFDERMCRARDNRIFFNFTTEALYNHGAELLLKNYGGEQIYFCIDEVPGVGEKISSLGQPLVARCALMPRDLHTHLERPWGSISVSAYHRVINPDAYQTDQDGWQTVPVPPERIKLLFV